MNAGRRAPVRLRGLGGAGPSARRPAARALVRRGARAAGARGTAHAGQLPRRVRARAQRRPRDARRVDRLAAEGRGAAAAGTLSVIRNIDDRVQAAGDAAAGERALTRASASSRRWSRTRPTSSPASTATCATCYVSPMVERYTGLAAERAHRPDARRDGHAAGRAGRVGRAHAPRVRVRRGRHQQVPFPGVDGPPAMFSSRLIPEFADDGSGGVGAVDRLRHHRAGASRRGAAREQGAARIHAGRRARGRVGDRRRQRRMPPLRALRPLLRLRGAGAGLEPGDALRAGAPGRPRARARARRRTRSRRAATSRSRRASSGPTAASTGSTCTAARTCRRARASDEPPRLRYLGHHRGHHAAQAHRGHAARRRPAQGRVPRHARPRAAQPARADPQRGADHAALARRGDARQRAQDHRAPVEADGAPGRRPAGRQPHQPGQGGAAAASRWTCGERCSTRSRPAGR